jgi:hypothetical protein
MSFGGYLQANTAVDVLIGPFIDDTDGKTAKTALTLSQGDIKLSKNGQALAQKNDDTAAAHDANGYYNCELDATDTNTEGTLTLIVHESGALPVRHDFLVISQAAYASIVTAKDSGYMDVNIKAISEDTTAPDNLELMYDGTGYAGGTTKLKVDVETIKTQAVTCSAGVTVLASVGTAATSTAQTGDSYAIVNGDHGLVSIQDDVDAIKTKTDLLPTWPANFEHLSITDTTGLVDITQTAADKAWGTAARTLTANTNLGGVEVDLTKIHGTALTETAGQLAAGFVKFFDVATPVMTVESVNQTGDSYSIVNGDHGLVSIQDDIDAILADTGELQTNQGNWLTATGFSTHSAADVVTAMETNGSKLDHLWEMTEDDGGVRRLTTNSLEQAPSGGASAADIADAVWDEAIADHTTATTFGGKNQKVVPSETINDYKATGFSTHSAADVWAVAARVLTANTNLSIPSAADIADAIWDEASTGHTDAGKAGAQLWTVLDAVPNTTEFEARTLAAADYTIVSDLGTVQTGDSFAIVNGDHGLVSIQDDIDAILADTGELQTNQGNWLTATGFSTHSAADVKTAIEAAGSSIASILADTGELQTDLVNGGRLDLIFDATKTAIDKCEDILGNKMEITDATGAVTLYADNSSTPLLTGTVVDDLTTTTRGKLT